MHLILKTEPSLCSYEVSPKIQFVQKGVPQDSLLGPLLFTLYRNNIGANIPNAFIHFYAYDKNKQAKTTLPTATCLKCCFLPIQNQQGQNSGLEHIYF